MLTGQARPPLTNGQRRSRRYEAQKGVQAVGLCGRFVGAEAVETGKAEGDAGFVAGAALGGVELDFDDVGPLDLADGTEAAGGVVADPNGRG